MDEGEGPRAKAQRFGKPHCFRSPDGQWIAVSPGGVVRWADTPREAAMDACYQEWLSHQLVRTPYDPYDYERTRQAFTQVMTTRPVEERISGVMPTWAEVLTVRH